MTQQATDSIDRPALTTDEIEITPEMIEVGLDALWAYYLDEHGGRVVVIAVYSAMRARLVEQADHVGCGFAPDDERLQNVAAI